MQKAAWGILSGWIVNGASPVYLENRVAIESVEDLVDAVKSVVSLEGFDFKRT